MRGAVAALGAGVMGVTLFSPTLASPVSEEEVVPEKESWVEER